MRKLNIFIRIVKARCYRHQIIAKKKKKQLKFIIVKHPKGEYYSSRIPNITDDEHMSNNV